MGNRRKSEWHSKILKKSANLTGKLEFCEIIVNKVLRKILAFEEKRIINSRVIWLQTEPI